MWEKIKKKLGREVVVAQTATATPMDIGFDDDTQVLCSNCQTPLSGGFCTKCGQKNTSLSRPIWYLVSDLTEDIISKDSKLFRTIGQIIFWPGSLTRDFMDGKRARFIPPVRLYLLCTVAFFLTLAVADVAILKIEFTKEEEAAIEGVVSTPMVEGEEEVFTGTKMGADREEILTELLAARQKVLQRLEDDDRGMNSSFLNKWTVESQLKATGDGEAGNRINTPDGAFDFTSGMFQPAEPSADAQALPNSAFKDGKESLIKQINENQDSDAGVYMMTKALKSLDGIIHVSQDPRRLNSTLNDWLSRVMIFLLPFFAILLRLFYWKRENCLMKQLVFSLHFHSALFLMMTFLLIAQAVWGAAVSTSMFFAFVPLYLFIAMKVANKQGYIKTTLKFLMVSLLYMITLSITVGLTLMLVLAEV